ncbi:hypothetical protein CRG98_022976 [Punica granatum]|uniref:Uncharacterized protein n=1 Tax=Punica granatum TaxID=22663 RepID=A0A2I0JKX2_PUNGR|nr:hypothetical protein CRG98_022976 [Punica granatum]
MRQVQKAEDGNYRRDSATAIWRRWIEQDWSRQQGGSVRRGEMAAGGDRSGWDTDGLYKRDDLETKGKRHDGGLAKRHECLNGTTTILKAGYGNSTMRRLWLRTAGAESARQGKDSASESSFQEDGFEPVKVKISEIVDDIDTSNRMFYGSGGPYPMFPGKDTSRAVALMSFNRKDLNGNSKGLNKSELELKEYSTASVRMLHPHQLIASNMVSDKLYAVNVMYYDL